MDRDWSAFPEENPNIVLECNAQGVVRYANPEAKQRFPDLVDLGWRHPLLAGITSIIGGFATGATDYVSREVQLEDGSFEQKICFGREGSETVFRIYVHDVTALRKAEQEMERLAARLATTQEEERHRISRELHDEAGQALAALKLSLQLLRDDVGATAPDAAGSIDQLVDLVESTRQQVRTIAHDLRPPALDAVGLDRALSELCSDFGSVSGISVHYDGAQADLTDAAEICLYRTAQEALANIATHSGASRASMSLSVQKQTCRLQVVDDGDGFDAHKLEDTESSGQGIRGMKERVSLLGGSLDIRSSRKGTTVRVEVPIA